MAETLFEKGCAIQPDFLSAEQLAALRNLFDEHHDFEGGGMFFSLFSRDFEYRKKIHRQITQIVQPSIDRHFCNYKIGLCSFVVKAPGKGSEFFIHQDPSFVDEYKHSPLHVWCSLIDMNERNGVLCVIEKTHRFFSPYRGASFPFPFAGITNTVRRYLRPLLVRAGEAIFLDPRLVHNSLPNTSEQIRPALLLQLFPKNAQFIMAYRHADREEKAVEIIEQEDDFFLKFPHFYHNVNDRPTTGTSVGFVDYDLSSISAEEFEALCRQHDLPVLDLLPDAESVANTINEPTVLPGVAKPEKSAVPEPIAQGPEPATSGLWNKIGGWLQKLKK